jgi:hypothetical protein
LGVDPKEVRVQLRSILAPRVGVVHRGGELEIAAALLKKTLSTISLDLKDDQSNTMSLASYRAGSKLFEM